MPKIPSLWREFAAIALHRQRPSTGIAASYPAGERYSVANGPMSSILVPVVLIGLLGDIPLSMVIVAMWHPTHPALIRVGVAALGLLGLGWAIAARSTQRSMPHVVSDDALWISGATRISAVIIERILAIRGSRKEWMSEHKVTRNDVILANGFDPPNLAVEIKNAAWEVVQIGSRQKQRPYCRWVLLYADKPAALATTAHSLAAT
jgi:hypothetical protein